MEVIAQNSAIAVQYELCDTCMCVCLQGFDLVERELEVSPMLSVQDLANNHSPTPSIRLAMMSYLFYIYEKIEYGTDMLDGESAWGWKGKVGLTSMYM